MEFGQLLLKQGLELFDIGVASHVGPFTTRISPARLPWDKHSLPLKQKADLSMHKIAHPAEFTLTLRKRFLKDPLVVQS